LLVVPAPGFPTIPPRLFPRVAPASRVLSRGLDGWSITARTDAGLDATITITARTFFGLVGGVFLDRFRLGFWFWFGLRYWQRFGFY
jgi:hypothetical protein